MRPRSISTMLRAGEVWDAACTTACSTNCEPTGVLHEVGFKFGRWIDTELWELSLSSGS